MAVVAWPPPTPPNTRANATVALDAHPLDHDRIADALDTIVARLTPLADVTVTAPVTVSATSGPTATTVATSPAVTCDGSPLWIEYTSPHVQAPNVAGGTIFVSMWDGSTDLGLVAAIYTPGNNIGVPVFLRRKLSPSAGSHTFTVRAYVSPSGSGTVQGGAGGAAPTYLPATLRIVRA